MLSFFFFFFKLYLMIIIEKVTPISICDYQVHPPSKYFLHASGFSKIIIGFCTWTYFVQYLVSELYEKCFPNYYWWWMKVLKHGNNIPLFESNQMVVWNLHNHQLSVNTYQITMSCAFQENSRNILYTHITISVCYTIRIGNINENHWADFQFFFFSSENCLLERIPAFILPKVHFFTILVPVSCWYTKKRIKRCCGNF